MTADRYKLIFYAPSSPPALLPAIKSAIFSTGAGTFPGGKYSHCAWQTTGTGQFLPDLAAGAAPHTGTPGRLEVLEEVRVEVLCVGRDVVKAAVEALKREHPYEEVAYEVYKMEDF